MSINPIPYPQVIGGYTQTRNRQKIIHTEAKSYTAYIRLTPQFWSADLSHLEIYPDNLIGVFQGRLKAITCILCKLFKYIYLLFPPNNHLEMNVED